MKIKQNNKNKFISRLLVNNVLKISIYAIFLLGATNVFAETFQAKTFDLGSLKYKQLKSSQEKAPNIAQINVIDTLDSYNVKSINPYKNSVNYSSLLQSSILQNKLSKAQSYQYLRNNHTYSSPGFSTYADLGYITVSGEHTINISKGGDIAYIRFKDNSHLIIKGTGNSNDFLHLNGFRESKTATVTLDNASVLKNYYLHAEIKTLNIKGRSYLNRSSNLPYYVFLSDIVELTNDSELILHDTSLLKVNQELRVTGNAKIIANNKGILSLSASLILNNGNLEIDGSFHKDPKMWVGNARNLEFLSTKGKSKLKLSDELKVSHIILEKNSEFELQGILSEILGRESKISPDAKLILNNGALTLKNKATVLDISIKGNSSLNTATGITTQTLNLTDKSSFTSGGAGLLEVTNIKSNGTNSFVVNNSFKAKNLELNAGTLNLLGTGVLELGTIKGNGSNTLVANNSVTSKTLELNAGALTLSGSGSFAISETLSITGSSSLNIAKGITTQTLKLTDKSSFTSGGTGLLEIGTIKGNGTNTLVANNSVKAKNLDLNAGTLTLSGSGSFAISETLSITGSSSLNIAKGITTQTLFLSNRSSFTSGGTGALEIETIKGNGINTLVANNSVKATTLELNGGALTLSGTGSLNVANGIKLLGKSKLNLTNSNTNMLASSKINNTSGVVNIGENKLNIANYEGGKGSELKLDINSSTNYGQLNVTNDFKITDGSFRIGVKYGLISDKGQQFNIVNANNISLTGNNLYIYDDVRYALKPILGDNGKTLNVQLVKTSLIDPNKPDPVDPNKPDSIKPTDDIINILTGLQNIIDNGNGDQVFDKDLAIFIADRDNKNYNALQLKPISNTTKKEMNSIVASGFNSMVTDRILSVSDTEEGYKTKMVKKRFRNKRTGKIVVKQVPVEVFSSSEGLNVWTMAGGNKASLKGSNLHGIDGNSSKDSQIFDTIQAIAGLDYIGSNIVLGVAGGFGVLTSKNQESVERHLSKGNNFNGTLYGKLKDDFNNYYLLGSVGFTAITSENSRFIDMPLVPKENKATTTDSVLSGYGELGINLNLTEFLVINPFVSGSYGSYTLSAYEEEGNGFILKMNAKTYSDIKAGGGLRIVANLGDLKPMIEASYEQKINKDELTSEMRFVNVIGDNSIIITDDSYSQNKLKLKAGLDYNYSDEIVIGVKGYQESNKEIINIGASIKVSYKL